MKKRTNKNEETFSSESDFGEGACCQRFPPPWPLISLGLGSGTAQEAPCAAFPGTLSATSTNRDPWHKKPSQLKVISGQPYAALTFLR
jgi:hypothetical protein